MFSSLPNGFGLTALWTRCLMAILGLCLAANLTAQDPFDFANPFVKTSGVEQGLPSRTVYAMAWDRQGRLWAGTQEGAAWFDGLAWHHVHPSEPTGPVRAVCLSQDGSLWLGSEGMGLWRRSGGRWTRYETHLGVNTLVETRIIQPGCWAGTRGHGVLRWDGQQWVQGGKGLEKAQIWVLLEGKGPDGQTRLWAGTKEGLWVLEGAQWVPYLKEQGITDSVNSLACALDDQGRPVLWAGVWQKGLARWDGRSLQWMDKADGIPSLMPTALCFEARTSGKGTLWMGTYDQGLAWFQGGRWRLLDRTRGTLFPGVYALLPGLGTGPTLWFGARGAGVGAVDTRAWRNLEPAQEAVPELGTVLTAKAGGLWVGSNQGLWVLDGSGLHRDTRPGAPESPINSILSEPDAQGRDRVWIASATGVLRLEQGRWGRVQLPLGVQENRARCLLRSSKGQQLWIGMQGGLACLEGGRWKTYSVAEGMPGDWVYSLCEVEDSAGETSLWVGSRDAGAFRLRRGRWESFPLGKGTPSKAWCNHLRVTTGQDGRRWLWAIFVGFGLGRLEVGQEEAGWRLWTPENLQGLPTSSLYRMEQDRSGRFYLGTNKGVIRFRLQETPQGPEPVDLRHFSQGDGVPEEAMPSQGSVADSSGRIWFGNQRALCVFDPEQEELEGPPPRPQLERVEFPDRSIPPEEATVFSSRQKLFRVEFVLPLYYRREDARFRTQLAGLEAEPGPWRTESNREFTGLPGGSYQLLVWAKDSAGRISEPVSWSFRILPPVWLTWWAKVLYGMGALGLSLGLVAFRTRVLHARAKALEGLVSERTRDLKLAKEGAETALAEVKVLSGLVMESIHYARTIQQTLLPAKADLTQRLPESFVIWNPRDVIGGDLYWFLGRDADVTVAIIDCTGHGVPGAIMTMLVGACLNRVVHELGPEDPARILSALNVLIRDTLSHEERGELTDAGLDMGICHIDRSASRLVFAGANIPLFYMKDGQVLELNPDHNSIGYLTSDPNLSFTNQCLDLTGEETCYLTTDGLFSIVGGKRSLPFGKSRFRRFLAQHGSQSFPAQRETLLKQMADYMGEESPRDDVTIIGFRPLSAELSTPSAHPSNPGDTSC